MGKFSAAKIFDAMDQKLQKAMNYLIDLLETGYVAEGRINGKNVRVEVSPKVGFNITSDNVLIGGITEINGQMASVSQIMTNDATDPQTWGAVGEIDRGAYSDLGLFLFRKSISESIPAWQFVLGSTGGLLLQDVNFNPRLSMAGNGTTYLWDNNNVTRITVDVNGSCVIGDSSGNVRMWLDEASNFCVMRAVNGASYNEIGVDATGVYKIISGGAKAYL